MSAPKLTPWFPSDVRPVRPGVYQRKREGVGRPLCWARWDGVQWLELCDYKSKAALASRVSHYQCAETNSLYWRGLALEGPAI